MTGAVQMRQEGCSTAALNTSLLHNSHRVDAKKHFATPSLEETHRLFYQTLNSLSSN